MTEPRSSGPIANKPSPPRHAAQHGRQLGTLLRADVLDNLARADGIGVVTLDHTPRPRPVFAVVAVHTTSSPAALKAQNLDRDSRCAFGANTDELEV